MKTILGRLNHWIKDLEVSPRSIWGKILAAIAKFFFRPGRYKSDLVYINKNVRLYFTPLCMSSTLRELKLEVVIEVLDRYGIDLESKVDVMFVRDPVARVLSAYNKKVLNCNTVGKILLLYKHIGLSGNLSFSDFVSYIVDRKDNQDSLDKHFASYNKLKSKYKMKDCIQVHVDSDYFKSVLSKYKVPVLRSSDAMKFKPLRKNDLAPHDIDRIRSFYEE